jgi:uncharacterized protein YndB with AHSA1/START domain
MTPTKTRTLQLPIFIHAPRKEVFEAISKPELLAQWFVDRATLSPKKGGAYAFTWEGGPTHTGKVLEFERGKRLTLSWQWPGQERLGMTRLRLTVASQHGGTVLTFTHSGFQRSVAWQEIYEGAIRGWTYFMFNLKSFLETGKDLRSPYDW